VRVRTLGKGSSGTVELCADRNSGQLRALKLISRKRQRRLALIRARSLAATAPPGVAPGAAVDELTDIAREVDVLGRLSALRGVINIFEVIGGCRSCICNILHGIGWLPTCGYRSSQLSCSAVPSTEDSMRRSTHGKHLAGAWQTTVSIRWSFSYWSTWRAPGSSVWRQTARAIDFLIQ